ncbi:MAG: hypothetical protein QM756_15590 [Polyangiaceae bacterium]
MASLFNSLVVCGAGLGLVHCGGEASQNTSSSGGAAGASGGTTAAGGATAASGATASGGIAANGGSGLGGSGLGGATSTSDGGSIAGAPGWGGAMTLPVESWKSGFYPSAQWNCDGQYSICDSGVFQGTQVTGRSVAMPCVEEPMRPQSPDDCAPNEYISCTLAVETGSQLAVPINCACLPKAQGLCGCLPKGDTSCVERVPYLCSETTSLCSCAMTCILK